MRTARTSTRRKKHYILNSTEHRGVGTSQMAHRSTRGTRSSPAGGAAGPTYIALWTKATSPSSTSESGAQQQTPRLGSERFHKGFSSSSWRREDIIQRNSIMRPIWLIASKSAVPAEHPIKEIINKKLGDVKLQEEVQHYVHSFSTPAKEALELRHFSQKKLQIHSVGHTIALWESTPPRKRVSAILKQTCAAELLNTFG